MYPHGLVDDVIKLQQKIGRVQSLLEASRQVHATIHPPDVLSSVPEIAAKQLKAHGAFFVSAAAEVHHRVVPYGSLPDDIFTYLVVYRPQPLFPKEGDFLEGLAVGDAQHHERTLEWERVQLDLDAARVI